MEKKNEIKNGSASLVLDEYIAQAVETGEEHNQTFIVDDFDAMEISLKQAVLDEMKSRAGTLCPDARYDYG